MKSECDIIRDLIADSFTETPATEQARHLDEHLPGCPDCRSYAEALRHEDLLLARLTAGIAADIPGRKEQLLQALSRPQSRQANLSIGWRRIMTSRMTKLTAAAIAIAAAILGLRSFNGTPVKAVEFSEITKAMSDVPWMHITTSGFGNNVSIGEQWIGFESRIHVHKDPDGQVSFSSEKDHKQFSYNPSTATITVSYMEAFPLDVTSPTTLVESMHKRLKDQGAEIVARMGDYQGRRVQVQEISLRNTGGNKTENHKLTLYIDPHSRLLYAAEVSGTDANGKLVMAGEITFDYPRTGPQSIYDLGVPRDAKIVNNMPGLNVHSVRERYRQVWGETSKEYGVMERYWQVRDEATREYIAVIAHNTAVNITDVVNMLDVDYKSGRRHRHERHSVFDEGTTFRDTQDPAWAISKQRLGETFESMLAWSRGQITKPGKTWIQVHLYDGEYDGSIRRDPKDGWGRLSTHYNPDGSIGPQNALADLAWPQIDTRAQIIQDDHATQHSLICFERLTQGHIYNGTVTLPGRFLYYLDPAWGYLCRRKVTEWRPDAHWQEDKDWLNGVDSTEVRDGSITIEEITKAVQAPNGHWYPETIIVQGSGIRKDYRQAPLKTHTVRGVYLNLSPEFPEGIFDIDKLPGQ